MGAYAVSAAVLRPWVGRVGDTKGRRLLAVGGCIVVAVSFLLYALVSELWMLVLARLVTGAGEAAVFVGVATAAQDLAPDHRRGEAASYFSVALYGGLALGPGDRRDPGAPRVHHAVARAGRVFAGWPR